MTMTFMRIHYLTLRLLSVYHVSSGRLYAEAFQRGRVITYLKT